jgi:hypothetical protein
VSDISGQVGFAKTRLIPLRGPFLTNRTHRPAHILHFVVLTRLCYCHFLLCQIVMADIEVDDAVRDLVAHLEGELKANRLVE